MGAVDLREFALPGGLAGVIVERGGPGRVRIGIDKFRLEAVDPAHETGQQQIGAPAEVMVLQ